MASVHARPLQTPEGLDPKGDEDNKMDREQCDQFRGVPGTGALRLKRCKLQITPFPTPGLLHALMLTCFCLSPQAPMRARALTILSLSLSPAPVSQHA